MSNGTEFAKNIDMNCMQTETNQEMLTGDELAILLKNAVSMHMTGNLHEAGTIYQQILHQNPEHTIATHNLGLVLLQTGQTVDAIRLLETALSLKPDYPEAYCSLGAALKMHGRIEEAIEKFETAVTLNPSYAAAWYNMAKMLHEAGKTEAALNAYGRAVSLEPDNTGVRNELANLLFNLDRYEEAVSHYEHVVRQKPDWAEVHCNYGNALLALEKTDKALDAYRRTLELDPGLVEIHNNIANAMAKQGNLQEAAAACRKAVHLKPDYIEGHYHLANLLMQMGHNEAAIDAYEKVIQIQPDHVEAYINLGISLTNLNRFHEAEICYQRAQAEGLFDSSLHYNLGNILKNMDRPQEAIEAYEQAIRLERDFTEAYINLARVLEDTGDIAKALSVQKEGLERCTPSVLLDNFSLRMFIMHGQWDITAPLVEKVLRTNFMESEIDLFSRTLFAMNTTSTPAHTLREKHEQWGELQMAYCKKHPIHFSFEKPKHGNPKIGYLSPDFRRHSVGLFLKEIIRNHNTDDFPIYCYALHQNEDDITEEIERQCSVYRRVSHLGAADIAKQIFKDGIDILVDLAGHTMGNRIEVLGYKPAPIQVTAIGYPNGTGLPTVDYRLTDTYADSMAADSHSVEKLVKLPNCFLPFIQLTVAKNSFSKEDFGIPPHGVAMASFNALHKLNPRVLGIWNDILTAQPDIFLLLSFKNVHVKALRDNIRIHFKKNMDRIIFLPRAETPEIHRARYRAIDLALDTFPYAGTTTSYEALYMGVPIVTLVGERHIQRTTYSFLENMGIYEGAAFNEKEYIQMAISIATDRGLRERVKDKIRKGMKSPELSAKAYTETLEKTYMNMWRRYQKGSPPTGFDASYDPNPRKPQPRTEKATKHEVSDKLNLHIGGKIRHPHWKILNIVPEEDVDFIGDASDLSQFKDESIQNIYASHVMEHLSFQEITPCLREWYRVLSPDGRLMISVPDLTVLCTLFASGECSADERLLITKMMMGSQKDPHDFHRSIFDMGLLCHFLDEAGFKSICQVERFGVFQDCSDIKIRGKLISLNAIVKKHDETEINEN